MQKLKDIYNQCLSLSKDDFKTYHFQSIKYFNVNLLSDRVEIVCCEFDCYTYIHIQHDEALNHFTCEIMSANKGMNKGGLTYRTFYNISNLKNAIKIPESAQTIGLIKNHHSRTNKKFVNIYFNECNAEVLDERP